MTNSIYKYNWKHVPLRICDLVEMYIISNAGWEGNSVCEKIVTLLHRNDIYDISQHRTTIYHSHYSISVTVARVVG